MKKCASYLIYTLLLAAIACACSDNLNIKQDYEFSVSYLPIPKKIKKGDTLEIRCQLDRSGKYENAKYFLRYFQPEGIGELRMDNGIVFKPNDTYDLPNESFSFFYTSRSDDQQVIDVYFFDNFGNQFVLSFSLNADNSKEEMP